MVGLSQIQGMDPATRGVVCADEVLADPAGGARSVELAILAALTDYRRAFARLVIAEGVDPVVVWRAMGKLGIRDRLPAALTAPLAP